MTGNNIIRLEETASTMDESRALAISGAAHGTVVIADRQTCGRGRLGRSFFSPKCTGLYMSFVLKPEELPFINPTSVTAFAGLCVCDAIKNVFCIDAKIKWVNDVMVNGKKVGGILTEALANGNGGVFAYVLGIGINVFAPEGDFPDEIKNRAGALFSGSSVDLLLREMLASEIINKVTRRDIPGEADLFARYKQKLTMLGKDVTVTQGGVTFRAKALDIDGKGQLIVQKDNGERVTLFYGDVSVTESPSKTDR